MAGRSFTDPILLAPTDGGRGGAGGEGGGRWCPSQNYHYLNPSSGRGGRRRSGRVASGQCSVPPPPPPLPRLPPTLPDHLPSGQLRYPWLYDHLPSWVYDLLPPPPAKTGNGHSGGGGGEGGGDGGGGDGGGDGGGGGDTNNTTSATATGGKRRRRRGKGKRKNDENVPPPPPPQKRKRGSINDHRNITFNSLGPTIEIFPRMPGPNISRACGGIAQLGERRQRRTPAGSVGRLVRYRCRSTLIAAVWLTWKVTRALLPRADRRSKVGIRLRMCLCFEVT